MVAPRIDKAGLFVLPYLMVSFLLVHAQCAGAELLDCTISVHSLLFFRCPLNVGRLVFFSLPERMHHPPTPFSRHTEQLCSRMNDAIA